MKRLVSIIAPVYNEEAIIQEFVRRTVGAIAPLESRYTFEIILVNDGSSDASLTRMTALLDEDPRVRIIELRRNYGQTPALQAGLDAARGQILVTLDADLQHFPEEIPRFLEKLEEGFDMVCGWRHERAEGVLRRWPSRTANLLLWLISGLSIHDFGTTFRAYDAELAKEIRLFGEFHRYIPLLGHVAGGRITDIPIKNMVRPAGKSNYGLGRSLGVFLDLLLLAFLSRYLDRPLRAFGKLGLAAFTVGAGILSVLLANAYIYDVPGTVRLYSGWFLMSVMLLLSSMQIILAGILAELIIRVHYAQGDRRIYRVRKEWHTDAPVRRLQAARPHDPAPPLA
jgi:glycosyltransferase involved in cell wall biosynthesis